MFRKSRKSSNVTKTAANEPRFLKIESEIRADPNEMTSFSVGSTTPKPLGFLSKLFKRSSDAIKGQDTKVKTLASVGESETRRKSLWQRSKSILRPKTTTESHHSNSTILAEVPIRGSGSAARLCYEDDAYEHYQNNRPIFDPDAFLTKIFEENDLIYAELKQKKTNNPNEQESGDFKKIVEPTVSVSVITAMIDNPSSKVEDELLSCSQIINCEQFCQFNDNPKLDSPLHPSETFYFSGSDESEDDSEESFVTSIQSYNSGNYNLDGVSENSLDEMAAIFGQMNINERPVQTLPDGTIRILVKEEGSQSGKDSGSVESIRFHNWTIDTNVKLRHCHSETLKMTEIGVNNSKNPEKAISVRSASVSNLPSAGVSVMPAVPVSRRRTVSAKISEIVAFFEDGAIMNK